MALDPTDDPAAWDLRFGVVAAAVQNTVLRKGPATQAWDLFPRVPRPDGRQTPEEIKARLYALTVAMGGTVE